MMSATEELDVEVSNDREDGELEESDVEEGTYVPLKRPEVFNPPSLVHMQIQDEQSDDLSALESSGSESDDTLQQRPKRIKLRTKRPPQAGQTNKKDKYNVWSKALQEDLLTEDMVGCDVTKRTRYGVESYDYMIKYRLNEDIISKKLFTNDSRYVNNNGSNKRTYSDRSNVKLRLGKRVNSNQQRHTKYGPKYLDDLAVSTSDPLETISADIADKLSEEKKDIVEKIVQVLGASTAMEIYVATQTIEANGGMLVVNGTRRRTPGGVYFFLSKRHVDATPEMVSQMFNDDKQDTRKIRKIRAKTRQKVMEQLKQSLTDSELPSLLSRGESTAQSEHGSNPPPSPATDARDCSTDSESQSSGPADSAERSPGESQSSGPADSRRPASPRPGPRDPRNLQEYDDGDFLEVMCNEDMDLF